MGLFQLGGFREAGRWLLLSATILIFLQLGGCVSFQAHPLAERSGDTISIALGSQYVMNKVNTQIFYYSDSAPTVPIEITSGIVNFFNLYADKTSYAYSPNNANLKNNFDYYRREVWQTTAVIDLPTSLPVGTGLIKVQTTLPQPVMLDSTKTAFPYPDVNTVDIALEILPGTGVKNNFDFSTTSGGVLPGQLADLVLQRQAVIQPPVTDVTGPWPNFGAIQFDVDLSVATGDLAPLSEQHIRVVAQDVTTFTDSKMQLSWRLNGNVLTVIFLSAPAKIQFYEPRFTIVLENSDFIVTPSISSIQYFDMNGASTIGPAISDYMIDVKGRII